MLDARKKTFTPDCAKDEEGKTRSIEAQLPPLPKLDPNTVALAERAQSRFREEMISRKGLALDRLKENQRVLAHSSQQRIANLTNEIQTASLTVDREKQNHRVVKSSVMSRHGLQGWSINSHGRSHINFRNSDGTSGTVRREIRYDYWGQRSTNTQCPGWNRYYSKFQACSRELNVLPEKAAYENAKNALESLKEDLKQAQVEEKERPGMDEDDRRNLLLDFAKLLNEPQLDFESQKAYKDRSGCDPLFLGIVKLEDPDVRVLNLLKEPTELVLSIPVNDSMITIDVEPIEAGTEYYLFGTSELFSLDRNDYEPMDFSPTSTRSAQRDLMAMLVRDPRNKSLQVSRPLIPSSVSLRGTSQERLSDVTKCFDLSELVRDCHYPITNQPMAETPKRLADNGLVLRNYQKTSLQCRFLVSFKLFFYMV